MSERRNLGSMNGGVPNKGKHPETIGQSNSYPTVKLNGNTSCSKNINSEEDAVVNHENTALFKEFVALCESQMNCSVEESQTIVQNLHHKFNGTNRTYLSSVQFRDCINLTIKNIKNNLTEGIFVHIKDFVDELNVYKVKKKKRVKNGKFPEICNIAKKPYQYDCRMSDPCCSTSLSRIPVPTREASPEIVCIEITGRTNNASTANETRSIPSPEKSPCRSEIMDGSSNHSFEHVIPPTLTSCDQFVDESACQSEIQDRSDNQSAFKDAIPLPFTSCNLLVGEPAGQSTIKDFSDGHQSLDKSASEFNLVTDKVGTENSTSRNILLSPKSSKKRERYVRQLEKHLGTLDRKIKELQQKEMSLDDLEDTDSSYIQETRFKQQFAKVYALICKLKNQSAKARGEVGRRFHYKGSRYESINIQVEKFMNKKKQFPDFVDIYKLVEAENKSSHLGISENMVKTIAEGVFRDVGSEMRRRRLYDFTNLSGCYLTDNVDITKDPADDDIEMQEKLNIHYVESEKKLSALFAEYTKKQEESKEKPVEELDDDPLTSESEEEEEEEGINDESSLDVDVLNEDSSKEGNYLSEGSEISCMDEDNLIEAESPVVLAESESVTKLQGKSISKVVTSESITLPLLQKDASCSLHLQNSDCNLKTEQQIKSPTVAIKESSSTPVQTPGTTSNFPMGNLKDLSSLFIQSLNETPNSPVANVKTLSITPVQGINKESNLPAVVSDPSNSLYFQTMVGKANSCVAIKQSSGVSVLTSDRKTNSPVVNILQPSHISLKASEKMTDSAVVNQNSLSITPVQSNKSTISPACALKSFNVTSLQSVEKRTNSSTGDVKQLNRKAIEAPNKEASDRKTYSPVVDIIQPSSQISLNVSKKKTNSTMVNQNSLSITPVQSNKNVISPAYARKSLNITSLQSMEKKTNSPMGDVKQLSSVPIEAPNKETNSTRSNLRALRITPAKVLGKANSAMVVCETSNTTVAQSVNKNTSSAIVNQNSITITPVQCNKITISPASDHKSLNITSLQSMEKRANSPVGVSKHLSRMPILAPIKETNSTRINLRALRITPARVKGRINSPVVACKTSNVASAQSVNEETNSHVVNQNLVSMTPVQSHKNTISPAFDCKSLSITHVRSLNKTPHIPTVDKSLEISCVRRLDKGANSPVSELTPRIQIVGERSANKLSLHSTANPVSTRTVNITSAEYSVTKSKVRNEVMLRQPVQKVNHVKSSKPALVDEIWLSSDSDTEPSSNIKLQTLPTVPKKCGASTSTNKRTGSFHQRRCTKNSAKRLCLSVDD